MKTIKVSEASNVQLDWLVAKCENLQPLRHHTLAKGSHIVPHPYYEDYDFGFTPTTDWAQMGPIIEREGICTRGIVGGYHAWYPQCPPKSFAPRLLVAAARCYVISKLGDTVEVPEELLS